MLFCCFCRTFLTVTLIRGVDMSEIVKESVSGHDTEDDVIVKQKDLKQLLLNTTTTVRSKSNEDMKPTIHLTCKKI